MIISSLFYGNADQNGIIIISNSNDLVYFVNSSSSVTKIFTLRAVG